MNSTIFKVLVIVLTAYMPSVLWAQANTEYGLGAGNAGLNNTSIGYYAGDLVVGTNNSFVGTRSGNSATSAYQNSFFGAFSGQYTTTGTRNTFTGSFSGRSNITGDENSFYGFFSGYSSTGGYNSFFGSRAGSGNTEGTRNAFIGHKAGFANQTGGYNAFLGAEAGYENNTSYNVFIGYRSGYYNVLGNRNAFLGSYSGYTNTGGDNTFMGYDAGRNNTSGNENVYIGTSAGESASSGNYNVAIGSKAGQDIGLGDENTIIGRFAGIGVSNGHRNVFIGSKAGENSQGSDNVFIGYEAGNLLNVSNRLVIHNHYAGNPLLYGHFDDGEIAINTNLTNGYNLFVNGDTYSLGGYYSGSDKRFKSAVKPLHTILQKVRSIQSYQYEYKQDLKGKKFPKGTQFGVMAQELQEVFPELVKESKDGYLAVNYMGLIPVLWEAVKELDQKPINSEGEKIQALEARLQALEKQLALTTGENNDELTGSIEAFELQNIPNPAKGSTEIRYRLPEGEEAGQMIIFDMEGKTIKTFEHLSKSGTLQVSSNEIGRGLFHYALMINGEVISIKKMIMQ